MIYNLSRDKRKYYSQRNNEIKPGATCKPTSTIECIDIAGWELPIGNYAQPEDNLSEYIDVEMGKGPSGHEDWENIKIAINDHFLENTKPIIGPRWDWNLEDVFWGIVNGNPFASSTWLTKSGHIVSIVGFETTQEEITEISDLDINAIIYIIVDDPYGNRTSGQYIKGLSGWNNYYSMKAWTTVWRRTGIQVRKKDN